MVLAFSLLSLSLVIVPELYMFFPVNSGLSVAYCPRLNVLFSLNPSLERQGVVRRDDVDRRWAETEGDIDIKARGEWGG